MKVTVVGLGHVGTIASVSLGVSGREVLATDIDPDKVQSFSAGVYDGFEPGSARRKKDALASRKLRFRWRGEVNEYLGNVALIAVGTLGGYNLSSDLSQVRAAIS